MMVWSGLRQATAKNRGLRIITPSITACPPYCRKSLMTGNQTNRTEDSTPSHLMMYDVKSTQNELCLHLVLLQELLNTPFRVDDLLLSREERMARGTDLNPNARFRGACLKAVAAGARDRRRNVVRVNSLFHSNPRLSIE